MKRNLSAFFLVCVLATLIPAFAQKRTINPVKLFTKSLGNDQAAELYSDGTWKRVQYFTKFDDLCPVGKGLFRASKGELYGFVDKTGKEIIPIGTGFNINLSDEDRIVMTKSHGRDNYSSIVLDTNGREVFRNKYQLGTFTEGMVCAFVNSDSYMYIDKWGNPISDRYYGLPQDFSDGMAAVNKYDKWGFIDRTGQLVIPFKYEKLNSIARCMGFREGVAVVGQNGRYGVIDKMGNELVPFKYENAQDYYSEGLLALKENDKWGVIDKKGNIVVPFEFDYIDEYHSGLARVTKNGKNGFIDRTGKLIIPCIYDYVGHFHEGVATCRRNEKYLLINKQGQEIAPTVYDGVGNSSEGLVVAHKGKKWGYLNHQGKVIIPFKYSDATAFVDGMAVVKDKDNHLFIIDKQGKVVSSFAPKYIPINQK